jgi:hypothetical protein
LRWFSFAIYFENDRRSLNVCATILHRERSVLILTKNLTKNFDKKF